MSLIFDQVRTSVRALMRARLVSSSIIATLAISIGATAGRSSLPKPGPSGPPLRVQPSC